MTLNTFTNGTTGYANDVLSNDTVLLKQTGRNLIRQLQDRDADISADGGEFAEAYIDSDGRKNSVNTTNTTCVFDTDKYKPGYVDEASGDTTHDPDGYTNVANAFDNDDATSATYTNAPGGAKTTQLGKTFSSKNVYLVKVKASAGILNSSGTIYIYLQTYNGSTWSTANTWSQVYGSTGNHTFSVDETYQLDTSTQGVRLQLVTPNSASNNVHAVYTLEYGDMAETVIEQSVASGTFSSTISTAFMTFLSEDWETGADVQFKLSNGSDDSGYLNSNEIVSFTAFASEPTTLTVKLIPKSSGPTAGYPSIKGVAVFE